MNCHTYGRRRNSFLALCVRVRPISLNEFRWLSTALRIPSNSCALYNISYNERQPRLCQQCHENRTQFLNLKLHTHAIQSARIFLLVPRFTSFFAAIFHAGVFCSVRSFWFAFPAEAAHAIHTNRFHFHSIHILHFVCRFYFIRWLPSARIHFMMMIYVCEADRRRRTRKKQK